MKAVAPLQLGGLGKAFSTILVALTATWAAISWLVFREIYVGRPLLIANLLLAAGLGWLYYKWRYHVRFIYDDTGFELYTGRVSKIIGRWADYEQVSLAHLGGGTMAVRLYRPKPSSGAEEGKEGTSTEVVEIPASTLGLDGFALRDEIMSYVSSQGSSHSPS